MISFENDLKQLIASWRNRGEKSADLKAALTAEAETAESQAAVLRQQADAAETPTENELERNDAADAETQPAAVDPAIQERH